MLSQNNALAALVRAIDVDITSLLLRSSSRAESAVRRRLLTTFAQAAASTAADRLWKSKPVSAPPSNFGTVIDDAKQAGEHAPRLFAVCGSQVPVWDIIP